MGEFFLKSLPEKKTLMWCSSSVTEAQKKYTNSEKKTHKKCQDISTAAEVKKEKHTDSENKTHQKYQNIVALRK